MKGKGNKYNYRHVKDIWITINSELGDGCLQVIIKNHFSGDTIEILYTRQILEPVSLKNTRSTLWISNHMEIPHPSLTSVGNLTFEIQMDQRHFNQNQLVTVKQLVKLL